MTIRHTYVRSKEERKRKGRKKTDCKRQEGIKEGEKEREEKERKRGREREENC